MGRGQVCVCVKKSRNDRMGLSDGGRFTSPVKLLPAYLLSSAVRDDHTLQPLGEEGGAIRVQKYPFALLHPSVYHKRGGARLLEDIIGRNKRKLLLLLV